MRDLDMMFKKPIKTLLIQGFRPGTGVASITLSMQGVPSLDASGEAKIREVESSGGRERFSEVSDFQILSR
jgi:hypothetical protein